MKTNNHLNVSVLRFFHVLYNFRLPDLISFRTAILNGSVQYTG